MAEQTSNHQRHGDTATISAATDVLTGESRKKGLARLWPFLGPAFIASIAYVDPGNFATNIQGGAQFGYTLLWVVACSNLMPHVMFLHSALTQDRFEGERVLSGQGVERPRLKAVIRRC